MSIMPFIFLIPVIIIVIAWLVDLYARWYRSKLNAEADKFFKEQEKKKQEENGTR